MQDRGRSTDEQNELLLKSIGRLGGRFIPVGMLALGAFAQVLYAVGMVASGELTWAGFAIRAVIVAVGFEALRRLARWMMRRAHAKDAERLRRRPLRTMRRGRVALWFFERRLGRSAIEGGLATYLFVVSVVTGAYARADRVFPDGTDWTDVAFIGGAAWFGARMLDSAWAVVSTAVLYQWRKELDMPSHRRVRPPYDDDDCF